MRGRTNITQRTGPTVIGGIVKDYSVSDEGRINAGDFVELVHRTNSYEGFGDISEFNGLAEFDDCFVAKYNLSTASGYSIGLFSYEDGKYVLKKVISSNTSINICKVGSNEFAAMDKEPGSDAYILKVYYVIGNDLMLKSSLRIDNSYLSGASIQFYNSRIIIYALRSQYYIYCLVIKNEDELEIIANKSKTTSYSGSKLDKINGAAFYFETQHSAPSTNYYYRVVRYLYDEDEDDILIDSYSILTHTSNEYESKCIAFNDKIVGLIHGNNICLIDIEERNHKDVLPSKAGLSRFNQVTRYSSEGMTIATDSSNTVVVKYDDDTNDLIFSNIVSMPFAAPTASIRMRGFIVCDNERVTDYYNNSFIEYNYNKNENYLQPGGSSKIVKKYSNKIDGVAKSSGNPGDEIEVYVPS